jgi:phosphatidylglycerophosphatase A
MLALGFGSGLSPKAPGTVGTLWAWLVFALVGHALTDAQWLGVIVGCSVGGGWACKVTAAHMGVADSSHMVIDEIAAFWLVLWIIGPATIGAQTLAFVLFRFFDAVKFGPTLWADRHFKGFGWRGAWGVMLDDMIAAALTLFAFAICYRVFT